MALDEVVRSLFAASLAESTKRTYSSQLRTYFKFCSTYGYWAFPASLDTILRYIGYLSTRLSYASIQQYVSVVRVMHEEGFPSSKRINYALRGVRRILGDKSTRKLPITLSVLRLLRTQCDLTRSEDLAFWCACLVMFYGMLRKSSLFPSGGRNVCIGDVSIVSSGLVLHLRYSKTVQFQQRETFVVLPINSNMDLCPVAALLSLWSQTGVSRTSAPLLPVSRKRRIFALTGSHFTKLLASHLSNLNLTGYSGHSFRRGGASHALAMGVPTEVIMAQGDWKSNCYLRYLNLDQVSPRSRHITKMAFSS